MAFDYVALKKRNAGLKNKANHAVTQNMAHDIKNHDMKYNIQ